MMLSRRNSLFAALVAATTLSACTGASGPSGASTPESSTGVSQAQAQTYGAAAFSGTVKAQAAPNGVFKTTPRADERGNILGAAPLTVMFNMCASTDSDPEDGLTFSYSFGDGSNAGRFCRAEHTYEKEGRFEATICVADKRLADRSEICSTYVVKVEGEGKKATPVAQAGNVTLCDNGWTTAQNGGICGIPSDPNTSYFFDFDSLQKVPVADPGADLSKGHVDCCNWNPRNGTTQVVTSVPASQLATVTCSASDGRTYSPGAVSYGTPSASVICLRTGAGRYVKYTSRTNCCGDMTIDYFAF